MLDILGAAGFGLACVGIYYASNRVKPPPVPQALPKVELRQVGPVQRSLRYWFPKSPYPRIPLTLSERVFILNRDKVCKMCGRKPPSVALEIDHIIPVSKGGTNDPSNLQVLCFDCNRGKGADLLS